MKFDKICEDYGIASVKEPQKETSGEYGGKGPFHLPPNHIAAITVPEGGSCCANCLFASATEDGKPACKNVDFIKWNGGTGILPAAPTRYCSDWYQPKK